MEQTQDPTYYCSSIVHVLSGVFFGFKIEQKKKTANGFIAAFDSNKQDLEVVGGEIKASYWLFQIESFQVVSKTKSCLPTGR